MNKELITELPLAFANTYELFFRVQGMHWNIEGKDFFQNHKMFELMYDEIYSAIDVFAEQIRAAGGYVGYGSTFLSKTNVLPESNQIVGSNFAAMLAELDISNEIVLKSLNNCFKMANSLELQGLTNFIADRLDAHTKHSWFIKASLK